MTFYGDKLIGANKLDEGARESFYKLAEEENEQFNIEPTLMFLSHDPSSIFI